MSAADGSAPAAGCHFRVEILDGRGRAGELACSAVIFPALRLPAEGAETPAVLLRRAASGDRTLQDWWAQAEQPPRRDLRITLLRPDGATPVKVWRFRGARPVRLQHGPLDAMSSALVMEELALAFERVEIR